VPLSLGHRSVFPLTTHIEYYNTIGQRYAFVTAHNDSDYVPKELHANGCGGFVNTGFLYIIGEHLTFDLFGEYSYNRPSFHSNQPETQGNTTQVGGLTLGSGLGYSF